MTILELLIDDCQGFADRFIPPAKDLKSDDKERLKRMRQMNIIRNCILHDGLHRNHKDCTPEEIGANKYNRLMKLVADRPELKQILESKI